MAGVPAAEKPEGAIAAIEENTATCEHGLQPHSGRLQLALGLSARALPGHTPAPHLTHFCDANSTRKRAGYPHPTLQETGCFPMALVKSTRDSNVFWLVMGVLMIWKRKVGSQPTSSHGKGTSLPRVTQAAQETVRFSPEVGDGMCNQRSI